MASLKEVNVTAADGAESPAEEEDTVEKQLFYGTSERSHVESLFDISEEEFLKELEPSEFHCHDGWETIRGWARVDPRGCILVTPHTPGETKHKEAANPTPSPVNPATPPNADNASSRAKPHCEPHVSRKSSSQKSTQLNQHITAMAAPQGEAPEWTVINALQETTSNLSFREKVEQDWVLRETHHAPKQDVSERWTSKPQKHSHRPNSTAVPIKNFTLLPPITPSQQHPQRHCSGKASEKGSAEENCFIFDRRSRPRGARSGPAVYPKFSASSAALTSKNQPCQHSPSMFSISVPKRYQVPTSSKPGRLHRTIYSTRSLHSSTAAN